MSASGRSGEMNPAQFIAKWSVVDLPERAASQEHFIDLCRLLGQPTPAEHDATGAEYAFEKGVAVTAPASRGSAGGGGFADVWWRGKFGWEYKRRGKHRDLTDAYRQLCQYREALDNPPLLVVCDIARTEIHTNFTGTAKRVHTIALAELDRPEKLALLRRVFTDPASFRPDVTAEVITKEVAHQIALLSQGLQSRGHDAHTAAHFLMKCMFCLFAEDVALLPNQLFTRLLEQWKDEPDELPGLLTDLFARMRTGGAFGTERIAHFNGGLFDDAPALPLTGPEVGELLLAARQDWSSVEPAIFGTLFERSLDPSKRAQIGAHYTSREDILLVVGPVILAPLRRQWGQVRAEVAEQLDRRGKAGTAATKRRANERIADLLGGFLKHLSELRILDSACGSGNFLYVAIQELLNLEKEVVTFAARPEIGIGLLPTVRPTQLHGIEINPYAAELAQVVIWIGYLQWMRDNGFNVPRNPILEPLQTIQCRDAILDLTDPAHPKPADWPETDFIVGNPPFLGSKLFRAQGLPEEYVQAMFTAYDLPKTSDLCCYWFELARRHIQRFSCESTGFGEGAFGAGRFGGEGKSVRVGLLATQGIRGGANRTVLQRIKETGDIFMAWADRDWVLDGANVHVSIVGFDDGTEKERLLDGTQAARINPDLTSDADTGLAVPLEENANIAFMGDTKGGAFDIGPQEARQLLGQPNPNGRPNSDVLRPWVNGSDITKRPRGMWIVDFGCDRPHDDAAGYEKPFGLVEGQVKPTRITNRRAAYAQRWWIHVEPRPAMRGALSQKGSIVTPNVTKHRLFVNLDGAILPDHQLIVFTRTDDYFFGVLHSSIHELWARRMGTQLREAESGFRYTPTTCFETFPLPWPPGREPVGAGGPGSGAMLPSSEACPPGTGTGRGGGEDGHASADGSMAPEVAGPAGAAGGAIWRRISEAAGALNEQRERWLNPPEWIEPIARQVDARDDFADVPAEARGLIRWSAIMAEAAGDQLLRKRTLTNLYNERPTWLKLAHRELDRTVLSAYAAVDAPGGWSEDWAEVWFDTGAGQPLPEGHPLAARRAEVDQRVLANLLRLNLARAGEEDAKTR